MIYELLFKRPSRFYATHVLKDKPADWIMRALCAPHFWKKHGYWPHFVRPRSYSEKIWNRMLFDRNPRWTMLSDKLGMRNYVASRVGEEYLIPLLWTGSNPEDIPFDRLPDKFVIKATHGCAYNVIVKDKEQLDERQVQAQLKDWLAENYCEQRFLGAEWGYKHVPPKIIIETFLDSDGGNLVDYKFRTFSGKVEFLMAHLERSGNHSMSLMCNRAGEPIDCELGHKYNGHFEQPANFEQMIEVAERLGSEFDFMRVDLYSVKNRVYFGELTPYPGAGCIRFVPRKYDFYFGSKWRLGWSRADSPEIGYGGNELAKSPDGTRDTKGPKTATQEP
jgi:hypothetical protein